MFVFWCCFDWLTGMWNLIFILLNTKRGFLSMQGDLLHCSPPLLDTLTNKCSLTSMNQDVCILTSLLLILRYIKFHIHSFRYNERLLTFAGRPTALFTSFVWYKMFAFFDESQYLQSDIALIDSQVSLYSISL